MWDGLFDWPRAADLHVELNKLLTQLLEVSKLCHLAFGLGKCGGIRERLTDGLASDLVGQSVRWAVRRLIGPVAMTIRLAVATRCRGDGTGPEIAQFGQLTGDSGTLLP
jgi:hypothetical protein